MGRWYITVTSIAHTPHSGASSITRYIALGQSHPSHAGNWVAASVCFQPRL